MESVESVMLQDPMNLGVRMGQENVDPGTDTDTVTPSMSLKDLFLQKTGQCQGTLETIVEKDEVMPLEQRQAMEAAMKEPLYRGFSKLKKPGKLVGGGTAKDRDTLTPQEYYQGSAAILLAGLFQGDKPSSVIATLRDSLDAGKMETSLLSLVLNLRQGHPGLKLEKWENVLGLVSTIQSNVSVKGRLREHSRNQLLLRSGQPQQQPPQQQQAQLPSWGATKMSKSSLESMWVIPLAYIVGYTVFMQRETDPDSLVGSFDEDIRPRIDELLAVAFPRLHPAECIDAGLLLLQLDLLADAPSHTPKVLCIDSIVEKLQNQSVLKLMVSATDLPQFNFLAHCAKVCISRLDKDDTERVVAACSQLMRKELATQYLSKLKSTPLVNNNNKSDYRLLKDSKGKSKDSKTQRSHREALMSSEFPILTYVDTLLVSDKVDLAIDVVVDMENCASLTADNKMEGWRKIFGYLFLTGRLFLDGFPLGREEYMSNRKLFIDKIVTRIGAVGLECLVDTYKEVLEKVAESAASTSREEQIYVQRACHQTVLRILQAKYNEEQGLIIFQKDYWVAAEKIVWSLGGLWPSLMLSSSTPERKDWAQRLLRETNEVPESMRFDGSLRPDVASLLNRREMAQRRLPEFYAASDGGLTEEAIEAAQEDGHHTDAANADVLDVEMNVDGEPCANAMAAGATGTGNNLDDTVVLDDDDDDEEELKDANHAAEQEAVDEEENVDNDVVEIDDSDDDVDVDAILPRGEYDDADNESDDGSVDEESVDKLLGGDHHEDHAGESSEEETYSDDEDEDEAPIVPHQAAGGEAEVIDIDDDSEEETKLEADDDDDDSVVAEEDTREMDVEDDDENEAKEEADDDDSVMVAEESKEEIDEDVHVEEEIDEEYEEEERKEDIDEDGSRIVEPSQSMDEAGSQTGYEPEDTHGFTEEEVSEAMHTEDEEEERQSAAARMKQPRNESKEPDEEDTPEPVERPAAAALEAHHTLSDMSAADERGASELEEDPGAESSELDEGDGAEALPGYADPRTTSWQSGRGAEGGATLMDFARRAQRQVGQVDVPDATETAPNAEPWHWAAGTALPRQQSLDGHSEEPQQQASLQPSVASDTNAAHIGASSISFLEEGSLQASETEAMEAESSRKVVVDHVPQDIQHVAAGSQPPQEHSLDDPSEEEPQQQALPQASVAGDTNVAHVGAYSVSFLEEGSLQASEAEVMETDSPTKVVVDHVPEDLQNAAAAAPTDPEGMSPPRNDLETPASRRQQASVMGTSFADTNAAHMGSVSFAHSIDYVQTDDENDEETPQKKVLVELPEAFESSPQKTTAADDEKKPAAVTTQDDTLPAQGGGIDDAAVAATAPSPEKELAEETPINAEEEADGMVQSGPDPTSKEPKAEEPADGQNDVASIGSQEDQEKETIEDADLGQDVSEEALVDDDQSDAANDQNIVAETNEEPAPASPADANERGADTQEETHGDVEVDSHEKDEEGVSTDEVVADVEQMDEAGDEAEAAKNDQTDDTDMDEQVEVASNDDPAVEAEQQMSSPEPAVEAPVGRAESPVNENMTLADLASPTKSVAKATPADKPKTGAKTVDSAGTLGGQSIHFSTGIHGVTSPMSAATSTDGSAMRSPARLPPEARANEANTEAPAEDASGVPKTARKSNRSKATRSSSPTPENSVASPEEKASPSGSKESSAETDEPVVDEKPVSGDVPSKADEPSEAASEQVSVDHLQDSNSAEDEEQAVEAAEKPDMESNASRHRADSVSELDDAGSDDESEASPKKPPKRATRASARKKGSSKDEESESKQDEDEPPSSRRATRSRGAAGTASPPKGRRTRGRVKQISESKQQDEESGGEDDSAVASQRARRTTRTSKRKKISESKEDDDSSDEDRAAPKETEEQSAASKSTRRSTRGRAKAAKKDGEETESEVEEPSVASSKNSRRSTRARAKTAKSSKDDESAAGGDGESVANSAAKPRRTTRGGAKVKKDEAASEDESAVASTVSRNTRRSARGRPKASEKEAAPEDDSAVASATRSTRRSTRGQPKAKKEDASDDDSVAASTTSSKGTRRSARGQSKAKDKQEAAPDEDSVAASATRRTRRTATKQSKAKEEAASASEADDDDSVAASSSRRSTRKKVQAEATAKATPRGSRSRKRDESADEGGEEEADDGGSVASGSSKSKSSTTGRKKRKTANPVAAADVVSLAPIPEDDTLTSPSKATTTRKRKKASEEEDDEAKTKAKPRGKKAAAGSKKAKTAAPDSTSDEDDDVPIAAIRARNKKGTETDDSESEAAATKPKTRAKKTTRKTTAKSAAAKKDGDDESVTSATSSVRRSGRANKGKRNI